MSDLLRKYKSLYSSTCNTFSTGEGVTITPASVTGLPTDTEITLTFDRVDSSGTKTPSKMERIRGTITGGNFVISSGGRAVEGTEQVHTSPVVEMIWNADDWNDTVDHILTEHNQDGTHKDTLVTSLKATGAEINTGTEDAKIVTPKAIADSYLSNGYNSLARQAIINGNFDVWQRGTSSTGVTPYYSGADRWQGFRAGAVAGGTWSRQDATAVAGSVYGLRTQRDSGNSSTNGLITAYALEIADGKKLRGKKLTLSFWAKCGANYSPTSSLLNVQIRTGTGADVSIANGFTSDAIVKESNPTLTTSYQKFTLTTTNVIASNVTNIGLSFTSDPVGTAGANDWFEIAQVQLCAGDVALPFMPKSYEEELRACQRYYYKIGNDSVYNYYNVAFSNSTTAALCVINFPLKMRITPTLGTTGTATDYRILTPSSVACSAIPALVDVRLTNIDSYVVQFTVASGLTAGYACLVGNNNSNAYLEFSAEL